MSGFLGIFRNDDKRIDDALLQKIAGVLQRRGPDGTCVWNQAEQACCFTLMCTGGDRQAAAQPVTLDDRFYLLGDVRLDGRPELIEQLELAREKPRPQATDEELILHAWRCWGDDTLPRLLGDFSFAVWDATGKVIICARDFVGARPFFHAQFAGGFAFSNTLDALRLLPEVSGELDDCFIGDFLLKSLCFDATRSVYRGIGRLPPAHRLILSSRQFSVSRFRKLAIEEDLRLAQPEEYSEQFRSLLFRVVKDRLPQKSVALHLSGGLDSASVCAATVQIAKETGRPHELKAFTTSWNELFPDVEPHFARMTANYLGLAHEVQESGTTAPWATEAAGELIGPEPTFQPFAVNVVQELQRIASQARVVLWGSGGDDVLTGQSWPYLTQLAGDGRWREIARTFGGFFLTHGRLPPLRGGFRKKIDTLLGKNEIWADYPDWLNPDFEQRIHLRDRWQELARDSVYEHPTHPIAYAGLHSAYWARVLEEEDAGCTGILVEARAPLLDVRLLEFSLRLPPVPWCIDKRIIREAMKPFLPNSILRRPKTPLPEDPLAASIRKGHWRPLLPDEPPGAIHQFVNWPKWRETLENFQGSSHVSSLHPLGLLYWLKCIENG